MMRGFLISRRSGLILAAALCLTHFSSARADDWLPISPNELRATSEPLAPNAAAIYLYRQIDRDDSNHWEKVYIRIKVLTDEGRSFGNVSIVFDKNAESIRDIEARTIRADGTIVDFDGTVYEKPVHSKTQISDGALKYSRVFEIKSLTVPVEQAAKLRDFYRIIDQDERSEAVPKRASH